MLSLWQLILVEVAAGVIFGTPALLAWSMISHFRTPPSERPGSGSMTAGVGAAMQELDRLLARPSVEHKVDAENLVIEREDDATASELAWPDHAAWFGAGEC